MDIRRAHCATANEGEEIATGVAGRGGGKESVMQVETGIISRG